MNRIIRIFLYIFLLTSASISMNAQTSGSISSYSRFGLGLLQDESVGFNRGMGSVGVALPSTNRLNPMNPASYAHIDSVSMIIDAGMHFSLGRMSQGNTRINTRSASLDYVTAGWRLIKGLGMSVGFMPYSTVAYSFELEETKTIKDMYSTSTVQSTNSYDGTGGLNRAFLGLGWRPFGGLSIGVNANIIWGEMANTLIQTHYVDGAVSSSFSDLNLLTSADLTTYRIDLGAQYAIKMPKRNVLTLGVTTSLGHNMGGWANMYRLTSSGDTLDVDCNKPYSMPYTVGAGAAWHHKDNLITSLDFHWEGWGNCTSPVMKTTAQAATYTTQKGQYQDRFKVNAGVEWVPNPEDRGYFQRVRYRFGIYYYSPYQKINGLTGPKEVSVSAGLGLPISNKINSRSVVNVSFQYLHRGASDASLIKENYVLFNLGITFNERWFMKFKIN